MVRDLRFTVYDIVGYLLPGAPAVLGMVLVAWALSPGTPPLVLPSPSVAGWIAIGLAAYLAGHAVQALANVIVELVGLDEVGGLGTAAGPVWQKALDTAHERVKTLTELDPPHPVDVYAVCDEWVAQHGDSADRELYLYREGFYRGLALSLLLLAIGLLAFHLRGGASLAMGSTSMALAGGAFWLLVLALTLTAVLFARRYRRFLRLRVRSAVVAFLVLAAAPRHDSPKE